MGPGPSFLVISEGLPHKADISVAFIPVRLGILSTLSTEVSDR